MRSTREEYEPWLRDYIRKRYPTLEPAMLAAINAFDSIKSSKEITEDLLAPIVEAASSSRRPLFENATTFLAALTGNHDEAREAVARMAVNPRSHVRFNAILCLGKATPLEFSLRLIRQGLRDKSASVRLKAADWAGRLRVREVVPELEQALEKETNAKARDTIGFELSLLRDGFIVKPGPDDGLHVATYSTGGGVAGRWVRRAELESRGLAAIVAEFGSGGLTALMDKLQVSPHPTEDRTNDR
jgi:hypothetical protein